MKNEPINLAVREHEVAATWEHQQLAAEIHRWFDIFNAEFFQGSLPTPFLQFARTRHESLGHYRRGRNDVGALHEINLNDLHLDRPLGHVLVTLLHEMTHLWQELFGQPGQGNYHNKEFTDKCSALGIPCTGGYRSYSTGIDDPLVSLLRRHGVELEIQTPKTQNATISAAEPSSQRGAGSKLKKWRCGCTNIRAAVEVKACCLKCGEHFHRAA